MALFLLSSSGARFGAGETDLHGFVASLTKPVRSSELFDCLASNLGEEPVVLHRQRGVVSNRNRLSARGYALARWTRRKYKRLKGSPTKAREWVRRIARQNPTLFAHWAMTCPGMAER